MILQDGATIKTEYGVSLTGILGITKQITDQAGKKRKGITDALGRMIRVIEDPTGQNLSTDYVFDTLGNLRKTIQGGQNRYFMHDSLGRLMYAKQPEQTANTGFVATDPVTGNTAWSVRYQYDDNGNITATTDARDVSVLATYDNLNRIKKRDYSDSTPDVDFHYDGRGIGLGTIPASFNGKTTRVASSVSETRYTSFDVLGRLSTHEQRTTEGQLAGNELPYQTAYEYNLSGALIEETYPSGRKVKNVLNNDGELALVQSKKNENSGYWTYANSINYDSSGAVTKMQLGNGRWETASYNSRQQITQIGLGTTGTTQDLLKLELGYGTNVQNNGSLREQKITVPGAQGASGFTAIQAYTYDDLNRLRVAEETVGGATKWKQTFEIDRYGNREYDTANTTTLGSCPQEVCNPDINLAGDNRLSPGQGYEYDAAGNITLDASDQRFSYDAENHQTELFASGNVSNVADATYWYDGDGRRVKKITAMETTIFVYNASGQLVAEYSTQTAQTPQVSYLTTDHLGSARVITNENGAVSSRRDYTAFGEESITAERAAGLGYTGSQDGVRKGYTGYEKDIESGLDFAQARYYNSVHGRFTSVDPLTASASIRNPQTFNRYSYVLNSPYKYVDPLGLAAESPAANAGCNFRCRVNRAINGTANLSDADKELALFHIRNGTALGYTFLAAAETAIRRQYDSTVARSERTERSRGPSAVASEPLAPNASTNQRPDPPSFEELWERHNGRDDILLNDDGTPKYSNQCAIRFSEAYIEAGFGLPGFKGVTDQGYALRALELKTWLTKIYGKPTVIKEENALDNVQGKQGIIVIERFKGISDPNYRFNHVDLWNGSSFRGGDPQWLNQPKTAVYFWEVK